jgi:hypothetical protein
MKLYAHVRLDGSIGGLVVAPEGKVNAGLMPSPELQVCEIQSHSIKGETVELDKLEKLLETNTVEITPAKGKLVRRKK